MLLVELLLLHHSEALVEQLAFQGFLVILDVLHLVLDELQLGLRLQRHVVHLALVVFVLLLDLSQLVVTVFFDLLNRHPVPVDELLVIFLLLIDLGLLILHFLLVLLFFKQDFILVVLFDFLDSRQEVLMFSFFLSLKLREILGVVEHPTSVFVPFLLYLVLLFVEKLLSLDFHRVPRLLDLA